MMISTRGRYALRVMVELAEKNTSEFIPLKEILYFESVDNKVFFYTDGETYETTVKLYQLEEKLQNSKFARISKSVLANLNRFHSIKPEKNSRLTATLMNGEKLVVSRQYIGEIKKKLGV
jgi:DNA-binding LytR/AlgR family response regulator